MTWADGTYLVWCLVVGAALALWWLAAAGRQIGGRRTARPGAVARRVLVNPYARAAVLLGWMWLGWHLFAR
ncbi:MAG: DUF6186 family protein [Acidimicrobiales bacterium]